MLTFLDAFEKLILSAHGSRVHAQSTELSTVCCLVTCRNARDTLENILECDPKTRTSITYRSQ